MARALTAGLLVLLCTSTSRAIVLSDNGRSDYTIVLKQDASPLEKTAAVELRDGLKRVTGVELPIKSEADVDPAAKQILIGESARTEAFLPKLKWDGFKDTIHIRTAGDNLILAGHPQRGSLYAVFTFLEDVVGVRWWTSSESFYPNKPRLDVGTPNMSYEPPLKYREAYYHDAIGDHFAFAARNKLNGQHNTGITPEWGGHYTIIGWCHTFYHLLPPEKYFAQHPEWYSLINGKRTTGNAQLCLTNEEMRHELVRRALKQIAKDPSAGIISISQNDCFNACQCEQCRAIVKEEGSESGPLIRFVNACAADIGKQYPDFLVETLAYQWSRHPPKVTHPAKNVLVRLCSIECDFANPLSGETNKGFGDDLRGWSKIAPNLFVWNYVTNFACYHQPHPNLAPLGDDLRFFVGHHVFGVFEQGDYFDEGAGDFVALRAWLIAHLLWNPRASQQQLRDQFLTGYYGAAGESLGKYLDLIGSVADHKGFRLTCYTGDASFISPEMLKQANEIFDEAERAVANDAEKLKRVQRERLPLRLIEIRRYDVAGHVKTVLAKNPNADAHEVCADYDGMVQRWTSDARAAGAQHWSEGEPLDAGINKLAGRCRGAIPPKLPKAGASLREGEFDVQQDQFQLYKRGTLADIVNDAKASDGKAASMPANHIEWALQYHLPSSQFSKAQPMGEGPWRCYVVARVDAKQKTGEAFKYGLWSTSSGGAVAQGVASLNEFADGDYHPVGMVVPELKPGMYFWIAPSGNWSAVEHVYVDRIYIVRDATQK